jgi:hypothetical protein
VSDVSAVVLTVGEPGTARALESLARQTLSPARVIVVEGVSPFFRAMNQGASQVETPFFVQVDADMILDPGCLATLRAAVQPDTGVAVGELRDELVGQRVGIKLFRTECFRHTSFPDRISPDTDFIAAIRSKGWTLVRIERRSGESRAPTIGEHRPDYTPGYTLRKYLLEGRRLRYRANPGGMRWLFGVLEASPHRMALLAQLGLAHGFFLRDTSDRLTPEYDAEERQANDLIGWLDSESGTQEASPSAPRRNERLRDVFQRFREAGGTVATARAGATAREAWQALDGTAKDWHRLVAKLGFGHGVFTPEPDPGSAHEAQHAVESFLAPLGNAVWRRW